MLFLGLTSIVLTYALQTNAQRSSVQNNAEIQQVSPTEVNLQNLPDVPNTPRQGVEIPRPRIPIGDEALEQIKAKPNCGSEEEAQTEEQSIPPTIDKN
jgi:hypothetical protein